MGMNRQAVLLPAFALAAALHVFAGWWLGGWIAARQNARLVPAFQAGESAVMLTLAATRPPEAPPPVREEPPSPVVDDPRPVFEDADTPEPETVPEPAPSPEAEPREPAPQPEPPEGTPPRIDADMRDKGVDALRAEASDIRPRYPLSSRMRGEVGVVKARADIAPGGRVTEVTIVESSGYPALDRAAARALSRSRFPRKHVPAGGTELVLSFRFRLTD